MSSDSEHVENIRYLDRREHVRMRPGMYIGGINKRALHYLVFVMLEHVVEQAYLGQCNHVWIELREGNTVMLRDDSPGLPTGQYRDKNLNELEALLQFRMLRRDLKPRGHWMNASMKEAGFAVANALSEYFEVENYHDGALWRQKYQHGLPTTQLVGIRDAKSAGKTGTQFIFRPDYTIFDAVDFDRSTVEQYGHDIAKLFPGMIVEFHDTRTDPTYETTFQYAEGMKTYIETLNRGNEIFHDVVHLRRNVELSVSPFRSHTITVEVEIAFQFSDGATTLLEGYANGRRTHGNHQAGLKSALLSCINEYMNIQEAYSGHPDFIWDEISTGLVAAISIYYNALALVPGDPDRVVNPRLFGPIAGLVFDAFSHQQHWTQSETLERIIAHRLSRR